MLGKAGFDIGDRGMELVHIYYPLWLASVVLILQYEVFCFALVISFFF